MAAPVAEAQVLVLAVAAGQEIHLAHHQRKVVVEVVQPHQTSMVAAVVVQVERGLLERPTLVLVALVHKAHLTLLHLAAQAQADRLQQVISLAVVVVLMVESLVLAALAVLVVAVLGAKQQLLLERLEQLTAVVVVGLELLAHPARLVTAQTAAQVSSSSRSINKRSHEEDHEVLWH
jgi:hypothetical protein